MPIGKKRVSVLELLKYLKRVFEDEEYIKRIPNWAVRDGKATRAWRDGKGKEVLGLGIVDGDGEEGEVVSTNALEIRTKLTVIDTIRGYAA